MLNKIFILIIVLLLTISAYCDNTDDKLIKFKEKSFFERMKFRGTVSFVWDYMFEIQDGIKQQNRFAPINYTPLDYTNKGDPDNDNHEEGDDGRIIGGTFGGTQFELYFDYHCILPFFDFDNSLMKNNNIKFSFHYNLSPVTSNIGSSITLTPVAFLTFQTGFLIGYGWNIPNFAAGIGINDRGEIIRHGTDGPHIQFWVSSTFQMDLAYIMPEKFQRWLHFVFIATPKLKYQSLLRIPEYQPYMYQECPGEKLSGWWFLAEILIGYRFIIIEDDTGEDRQFLKIKNKNFIITIGFYLWLDYMNVNHYWDSPMSEGWGSDFTYINFGPAMQFDLPYNFFLKLFFFFCNDKSYTSDTVGNKDFRDRKYEDWYIYARWFGLFFGWNF